MNRSLNILMICKSLPWRFKGGIQTHTWQLAKALTAQGHQLSILTAGSFKKEAFSWEKDGINIIEIPYLPGRYIKPVAALAEELAFNVAVKKWVKAHQQDYQVIHAQGRSGYLLYTNNSIRPKLVNTIHGLISRESKGLKPWKLSSWLHIALASNFESGMMKHASQCLSVSADLQADIHQIRPDTAPVVIPNGVDCDQNEPMMLGRKPARFLFIGRLHQVKGILPLVKAMANAPEEITLDLIGNGPQKKTIEDMIVRLSLQKRVRLLGEHSNEKVQTIIPYYQAVVLPSHYETQGIVLLEANAHAVPVIASDIAAIRESVTDGENGLLCEPANGKAFVEAMVQMIADPISTQLMGIRGRKRVIRDYDWQQIARETAATYQRIAC